MLDRFPLLHQCYRSGQISESQWQEHLKDPKLKKWIETMNDEVKHTPLPWESFEYTHENVSEHHKLGGHFTIGTEEFETLATVRAGCGEAFEAGTPEANAAFIIKACNSHYQLVEENKRLREALELGIELVRSEYSTYDLAEKGEWLQKVARPFWNKACEALYRGRGSDPEAALAQHKGGE